jgi:outer membrane protein
MTNIQPPSHRRTSAPCETDRHWSLVIGHWSFRRTVVLVLAVACTLTARAAENSSLAAPGAPAPVVSLSNPLTLDDAIRIALEHNQRVKVSSLSREISHANVLTAYGAFDPALTFRRSYSQSNPPVTFNPIITQFTKNDDYSLSLDGLMPWGMTYSIGGNAENQRGTFNAFANNYTTFGGISVTQPLLRGFGFGATLQNLRVAKANRGISDWQHRQTVIDIVTSVIVAYNNLLQARDNVRIAEVSRDLAAQLLGDNQKKLRVGATSEAEVTQARARVANREESILFAQRAERDIANQFHQLLGESTFSADPPTINIAPLTAAPDVTVDVATDLKRAYDLRPDYQAARLGLTISRANSAAAQNALLPRLDFVGSYGYSGLSRDFSTARAQVRDEDYRSYSAGVVVRVPLTFTEGRGRARAARLDLRRSEADLVRLQQDIAVDVASAAGQIETTQQRVKATRAARDLAAQALEAEQKRFTAGTSNTFFVSQLQEQLTAVENSYARALADQRRAIASYERELGTTLATHNITLQ